MTQEQIEVANDLIEMYQHLSYEVCTTVINDLTSYRMKPYLTVEQANEAAKYWIEIRRYIYDSDEYNAFSH